MNKIKRIPKNLIERPINGGDGVTISPGDGIIAGGSGPADPLTFGIYLGHVPPNRLYYQTMDYSKNLPVARYLISYAYHKPDQCEWRVTYIPIERAMAAMDFLKS